VRIVFLTFFFLSVSLEGREFFISFQYSTQNYKLIYSKFNCSKSLTNDIRRGRLLFSFDCEEGSVLKCCKKYQNLIVDKLLQGDIILTSRDKIYNTYIQTHKKLTFLPHKFDIIIKNDKIYFYEGIE